jgi:WD40 repeat protein
MTFSNAFSPDGAWLAAAGELDQNVRLFSLPGGMVQPMSYHVPMTWLTCVAFSPGSEQLAVGGGSFSHPGQAIVFDRKTRAIVHSFEVRTNTVRSVAFSADGKRLAAGSAASVSLLASQRNGQWHQWDLATGKPLASGD